MNLLLSEAAAIIGDGIGNGIVSRKDGDVTTGMDGEWLLACIDVAFTVVSLSDVIVIDGMGVTWLLAWFVTTVDCEI